MKQAKQEDFPTEVADVNYYRTFRNTMHALLSHIAEIEANLECVQADPTNSTSAFYFMYVEQGR